MVMLFAELSCFPSSPTMRISGTTNSITTEAAPRTPGGHLTPESPDAPAKTSHIPS
jgi:hypothetical protein